MTSEFTPPKDSAESLDWLAFCYYSGDLSPAQQEDFELRLATEQPAREALARAVDLALAVSLAGEELWSAEANKLTPASLAASGAESSRFFSRAMQATAWCSLAAAACLAIVVSYLAIHRGAEDLALRDSALPETAWLWVQVNQDLGPEQDSLTQDFPVADSNLPESPVLEEEYLAGDVLEESDADELPSWLLTAVSSSSAEDASPETEPALEPESNPTEEL